MRENFMWGRKTWRLQKCAVTSANESRNMGRKRFKHQKLPEFKKCERLTMKGGEKTVRRISNAI